MSSRISHIAISSLLSALLLTQPLFAATVTGVQTQTIANNDTIASGWFQEANDRLVPFSVSSGNVGIWTASPWAKLDIAGSVKIADGTQWAGKVLTSDANGRASWQTVSGGGGGSSSNQWVTSGNTIYYTGSIVWFWVTNPSANIDISSSGTWQQLSLRWSSARDYSLDFSNKGNWVAMIAQNAYIDGLVGSWPSATFKYTRGYTSPNNVWARGMMFWYPSTDSISFFNESFPGTMVAYSAFTPVIKMVITGWGNVWIWTSSPWAKLEVNGDIKVNWINIWLGWWGLDNIAIWTNALYQNTSGLENTALWKANLSSNISWYQNTALWNAVLNRNTSWGQNSGFGAYSLTFNTTWWYNVAWGFYSMLNNTTWSNNIWIGWYALSNNTTWSNNIAIWYNAQVPSATNSNQLSIGNWIYGDSGNIWIWISSPTAKLDVNWEVKSTFSYVQKTGSYSDGWWSTAFNKWLRVLSTNNPYSGISYGEILIVGKGRSDWFAKIVFSCSGYGNCDISIPFNTLPINSAQWDTSWGIQWVRVVYDSSTFSNPAYLDVEIRNDGGSGNTTYTAYLLEWGNMTLMSTLTDASSSTPVAYYLDLRTSSNSVAHTFSKWNIVFMHNGNVWIWTSTPWQKLSVAGTIESTTGWFKFPDGTTQTTASSSNTSGRVTWWCAFGSSWWTATQCWLSAWMACSSGNTARIMTYHSTSWQAQWNSAGTYASGFCTAD